MSAIPSRISPISASPAKHLPKLLAAFAFVFIPLWILRWGNKWLRIEINSLATDSAIGIAVPVLILAALAAAFAFVRYGEFVPILKVSLRSSALGLLVYLLVEPPSFTLANAAAQGAAQYVSWGYYFAVALAALSLVRPSFILPVAAYIISTRYLVDDIAFLQMSTLDIRYMVDMAAFLSIFGVALAVLKKTKSPFFASPARQIEITFIGFGLHLANYFWSAIAKIAIGPNWWTWVTENRTFNTIPYAAENGTLPIGHIDWLLQFAYDTVQFFVVPLNACILAFQLFAIACVFKRHWLKIASVFYDLLHLGIYVLGGLFFWPWIWNNITVYLAARTHREIVPLSAKVMCVLCILLGYPGLPMIQAAWLGWFDVVDARQTYFEAVTPQGNFRVPTSFFLSHSYSVSHGYMDTVAHVGHYAHTWWGSAPSYERHLASGKCIIPPPVDPNTLETEEQKSKRLEKAAAFIKAHHAKMLGHSSNDWWSSFYFRSHHHPSNSYLYAGFNALNLKEIEGYNLVVESACLSLRDGRVEKKVVGRLEGHIDVK